jgi:hypothetical protein
MFTRSLWFLLRTPLPYHKEPRSSSIGMGEEDGSAQRSPYADWSNRLRAFLY